MTIYRADLNDAFRSIAMVAWQVAYNRINGWSDPVWNVR
jgi:hypothetical protein